MIEREIRERLGIRPGAVAIQSVVGDRVEIRFIPPAHSQSLFGILKPYVDKRAVDKDWAETKGRAWARAVRESDRPAYGGVRPRKRSKGKGRTVTGRRRK